VVLEDMDYTMLKNKFMKSKKMVAGEIEPGFSSEWELMAKCSTPKSRNNTNKSVSDGGKQSSDRDQNVNKSQIHNQAKERVEAG
jgi:hypothetical protein